MIPPEGYTLDKCLRSTARSEVYSALRDKDGRPVVLKSYVRDRTAHDMPRARHEFEVLTRVQGPGIVRPLALEPGNEGPVLVLERAQGMSLCAYTETQRLDPATFLRVAASIADSVQHIHAQHVVHRDIKPGNIIIDPQSLETHILDFGLADPIGAARRRTRASTRHDRGFDGTLLYMSPEQTGRMDRGVDARSDLYSLGATFYHMLAGHPPFDSQDVLELIHAHMARQPVPLSERRPDLPVRISEITLKLLRKAPEERYQSAASLAVDLRRAHRELEETGEISPDWLLGAADAPARPVFSQQLLGREAEIRTLRALYRQVAAGDSVFLLIRGALGVGKSALVQELRPLLAETSGYLTSGRFDPFRRDLPYAGLIGAFESLVDQTLTESDERLVRWRDRLAPALGNLSGVASSLIPGLELLLDEVSPVPDLGPGETQVRLALAVRRFLTAFAAPEQPLVLHLDDLQWSDPGSRYVIEDLVTSERLPGLMIVGTCRTEDVSADDPIEALISRLRDGPGTVECLTLSPLSLAASTEMLAEALGSTLDRAHTLAEHIERKTGNRPLLIQQFVSHMHEHGAIRYDDNGCWVWDEAAIAAANIPDDAVDLVTTAMDGLDPGAREILEIASCVGAEFDIDLLAEVVDRPIMEIEPDLHALCDHGLIAPCDAGFRFVHERIREAGQALLEDEARAELHSRMGRLLLDRTPPEELPKRIFEIADHLNCGVRSVSEEDRLWMAGIELRAGKQALRAGSPDAAARYLAMGRDLLRDTNWASSAQLGFDLWYRSADCAFQIRDLELASQLLDDLERHPLPPLLAGQVAAKRIAISTVQDTPQETLRLLLAALRKFDVRWPEWPSRLRVRLDILRTDWLLRGPLDETVFKPARGNSDWYAPLLVMSAGGQTMPRHTVRLIYLVSSYAVRAYRRRGLIGSPSLGLSAYAAYRQAVLRNPRDTRRYAEAALAWDARRPDPRSGPRSRFTCYAFALAWLEPRRKVLEPLRQIAEDSREAGDLEYAWLATRLRLQYLTLVGESLPVLEKSFRESDERAFGSSSVLRLSAQVGVLSILSRPDPLESHLESQLARADHILETFGSYAYFFGTLYICALYVLGRYASALERARAMESFIFEVNSMSSHVVDFCFFRGLCAAALARERSGMARRRLRRQARRDLRQLRIYARAGPDFVHMVTLLEAELARAAGDAKRATRLYVQAADRAQACGYGYHAAIAHERRAELLAFKRQYTDAGHARRKATILYEEWGAMRKVLQLQRTERSLTH